ncbi:MAG: viologen exporter family transport system ATP-binding protein [Thermosipho sp. (in: thermotogales)]|nr:ATPase component [Thermosipho sp. (in: thermotogales)]MDK2838692.1 viologen exporter family transport system ATP-binding protein [Thermosipho sp. (in: thermotogales)]MDK2887019.1 viologen exporter family transport system ATP-binding protein [Thermosipho sp. (in: thermotogales)]
MLLIKVEKLTRNYKIPNNKGNFFVRLFNSRYKTITALNNVSFTISKGEKVAVLGLNGSGKSTLFKILTGIISPSSGSCKCLDYDPFNERKKYVKNIGVLFGQKTLLIPELSVYDCLKLYKAVYELKQKDIDYRLKIFDKHFGVEKLLHRIVRTLSLGERMKAEILMATIHDPLLFFFDEPTIGLDVQAKNAFKDFLLNYPFGSEKTVLITTHDISVIKEFATRILLLNNGKLVLDIKTKYLKDKFGFKKLVIDFKREPTKSIMENIKTFGCPIEKNKNKLIIKVPVNEKEKIETIKKKIVTDESIISFKVENMDYEETINWLMGEFYADVQKIS